MQTLARDGLTAEQVTALLLSDALDISAGCELLRPDLTVVEDVTDDLEGGKVRRSGYAAVHGVCSLRLARELAWGIDLVRPYMVLTGLGMTARFSLGVYALTTPASVTGEDPVFYDVDGFDRLYLLNRPVAAEYVVTAGTTYRQALLDTFAAAGLPGVLIEGSAADDVLPVERVWSLVGRSTNPDQTSTPATWLRIVNDLLTAINFRAVWADENGLFRCESYRDPLTRPSEFTFTTDAQVTILGEARTLRRDVWATPNRWLFRQTNRPGGSPPASIGDGLYEYELPDEDPMSAASRGLDWPVVIDYEAASQDKLVELGDRRVALDRRRTASYSLTTGPFPCAGHFDVFTLVDDSGSQRVQAVDWSFDLSGSDVTWLWEAIA